jgi:hypothetical protein
MKNTIRKTFGLIFIGGATCIMLSCTPVSDAVVLDTAISSPVQTTMVEVAPVVEEKDYSYLLTNYDLNIENYIKDMTLEDQLSAVENIQNTAHMNAEEARSFEVCDETLDIIDKNKEIWYNTNVIKEKILIAIEEYNYNLELLARVIWYEAGSNWLPDEQQQLVGLVVMNRVKYGSAEGFRDTIEEVLKQKDYDNNGKVYYQYNPMYVTGGTPYGITQRCYDNAKLVLDGKVTCPETVIFQAEFKQGEVYKKFYNEYSGTYTYFCYD